MRKFGGWFGIYKRSLLRAAELVALGALIVFGLVSATQSRAQSQTQTKTASANPPKFEYDVASIRPARDPDGGWKLQYEGDTLRGLNVSLLYVVKFAFGTYEDYRILGAPKWLDSTTYDISAKIDAPTMDALKKLPRDQQNRALEHMLQDLLAERFQFAAHRETKELPVYFLVVGKNGPKLPEAKPDPDGPNHVFWGGPGMKGGIVTTTAHNMTTEGLANYLTEPTSRTVLDKTGLTGTYEFTLRYTPDNAPQPPSGGADAPSLFTALQEQLGLKLEPGKGPVEVIVIDHVEKPSGN
ncbi:MAG: TIGR03435 family protein [Candidatus Acidiferrales bacterium]